ncbi:hypothetical protein JJD41_04690 [Oxynema sp. CENA135]|uniref:HD domain-containing protein n=1 Tax=Oxynema sp. CENA135 TaxID=984206 RepID=UPI00190D4EAA|nr:hypothetical protein [Oxynema sp. CENA135]MBK4729184.1 hypothetical protein [Oxynema sp. CENA135]
MEYVDGLALKASWEGSIAAFGVDRALGKKVLFELVSAYCSAGRFYHTLAHLQRVLNAIDRLRSLARDLDAIQLAAWFHDAVYDPTATDNERQSAQYARRVLGQLQIPTGTVERVVRMILSTEKHQGTDLDIDTQILLDADLSVLGVEPSEYEIYLQGIRREYSWLSDRAYVEGRLKILRQLLERDRIYLTEPMFCQFEAIARQNIAREVRTLSARSPSLS